MNSILIIFMIGVSDGLEDTFEFKSYNRCVCKPVYFKTLTFPPCWNLCVCHLGVHQVQVPWCCYWTSFLRGIFKQTSKCFYGSAISLKQKLICLCPKTLISHANENHFSDFWVFCATFLSGIYKDHRCNHVLLPETQ